MQRPNPETVTLNDILITEELSCRTPRSANLQAENQAMRSLAQQMARDSQSLMQTLADTALELCQAGTAGVSLLETIPDGEEIFRWTVLAGTLAHHVGETTPCNFSPCGVCLDQGSPVLFSHPEHYFTYFQAANTPIVEGLVLPLIADSHVLGTIWILSHDERRQFDSEDVRVMTSLADFTATALLLQQRQIGELLAANAVLETEIVERKQAEAQTHALISNLPGGAVFVVDRDLRYLLAEGEALAISGFKPEDFVGRTIFEGLPPDLAANYEPMYRQALAGEPFEHEHHAHNHWYISRGTPLRAEDGEIYAVLVVSYDITERKQSEAALHESEARFHTLADTAPALIWYNDAQGNNLFLNQYFLDFTGKSAEAIRGEGWHELIHPDDAEAYIADYLAAVREQRSWHNRNRIRRHDGVWRWHDNYAQPLFSADGVYLGHVGVTIDNTEAIAAEIALQESEQRYRHLVELTPHLVWNADEQGRNTYISPQMGVYVGLPPEQLLNLDWETVIHPEDVEHVHRTWIEAVQTGIPYEAEYRLRRADGEYRWHLVRAVFEGNGQGRKWFGVSTDIHDRKQAEAQLSRAAEMDAFRVKLADALRSLADPIEIQRAAMRVLGEHLQVDRVMYAEVDDDGETYSIAANYVRGAYSTLVGRFPTSNFGTVSERLRAGETFVVENVTADERLSEAARAAFIALDVYASVGVPLIKAGRWVANLGIQHGQARQWTEEDIELVQETAERTWAAVERAYAEAALRESELQRVREQSALEQERQRAEALAELDRAKTAFFSNVSHEFRTPLTLSLAPLQDALSDRTHPLDPVHQERLELVHRNSLRLLKLVNTLLDFSRIEAGRMEAVYEPTDLATYTTELASVFRSAIERAGLQLIVDCPPLPEPVFVDREMWEKIVLNLLSNAFKFTFEGVITVRLRSADRNQAILQIQDTGTGIAPEHLPHLFERFYQVRGTQARTHEGSGIGLALVNELVRLQGGTIEVSSTVGQGTCFTISLLLGTDHLPSDPLKEEGDPSPVRTLVSTAMGATAYVEEAERWLPTEAGSVELGMLSVELKESNARSASSIQHSTLNTQHSQPACVLVVDDNTDMREYLTRILSQHVKVEAVADGITALAVAQERIPDLILSDVMMPGLDGFELLEALRADSRTREIPIILLSARAGEEAIVEGLEAGADDYLIKPFSAQELISRVTAHLQMAQLRGEALQQERSMNRQKDEFISVVSHELNTPLVSILGWTRMLRSSPPNPVMLSKALDTIERNATLQGKLVQDLLDLSRITAGKLRLNLQSIALKPVIETAIATVTQPAADKGIHLTWQENVTEPVVVMGDSDRLGQVICNLLTNAIKFTPESGSVRVELSVKNGGVEEWRREGELLYPSTPLPQNSFAQITITDTGIGIAADFLPHVFERFHQAEGAHSAKGLGLGLAIVRHIVELHNGTIHAESAGKGQGATFTVRLPLL
jgi:PAS domain S-box-containing protein